MLNAYLKDLVYVVRHGATNGFNEPAAPTVEPARAFVTWKTRLIMNAKGEQELASCAVMMAYDSTLTHEDKLRINGIDRRILSIEEMKDFSVVGMMVYIQ